MTTQTATLEHMAGIAEGKLGEPARALELLRRALAVDHFNAGIVGRIAKLAEQHRLWKELLTVYDERFGYLGGISTGVLDTFYAFYTPGERPRKVVAGIPDEIVANAPAAENHLFVVPKVVE